MQLNEMINIKCKKYVDNVEYINRQTSDFLYFSYLLIAILCHKTLKQDSVMINSIIGSSGVSLIFSPVGFYVFLMVGQLQTMSDKIDIRLKGRYYR